MCIIWNLLSQCTYTDISANDIRTNSLDINIRTYNLKKLTTHFKNVHMSVFFNVTNTKKYIITLSSLKITDQSDGSINRKFSDIFVVAHVYVSRA